MYYLIVILSVIVLVLFIALIFVSLKLDVRTSVGLCKSSKHLVGKVVIVTGADCGLGYTTALDLAERGAKVIITAINDSLGIAAKDRLIAESGNKDVHYYYLDLSSFNSVKRFADTILKTESKLDVLINNAGILCHSILKTEDGLDPVLQVNYFGLFLLTNLLLPLLKSSAPSRIVNVSSALYSLGRFDLDNLNKQRESCNFLYTYSTSKLYVVIFTSELAHRLKGTRVIVNCLHPGMIGDTQIGRANQPNSILGKLYNWIITSPLVKVVMKHFVKSQWEGVQTAIYLAVSSRVDDVSGFYFCDCRITETNDMVQNKDVGEQLWRISEEIVQLKKFSMQCSGILKTTSCKT